MSSALPTSITSSRQNILVLCLAFISGFIIMAIELLGGRILAPYFGSSIYVWGSIITVFMLSLSIGYLTGGRLSLHNPRLTLYGSFFATAAALLFPLVFWGDAIMEAMFLRIEDPRYGSLVVSMLLFFLPTAVMGMIAPYSVRLLVMDHQRSGQIAGKLYLSSTLGSALGTLATSFYLVLWFEVNQILLTMSVVLALAGALAITVGRNSKGGAPVYLYLNLPNLLPR
jgi:MFS family permease